MALTRVMTDGGKNKVSAQQALEAKAEEETKVWLAQKKKLEKSIV